MDRFYGIILTLIGVFCSARYVIAGECGYKCSPEDKNLDCWRGVIDYYSDIILDAMNQRAIVANHIGEWKRNRGLAIVDLTRVGAVLDRIAGRNPGPLPDSAMLTVFGSIVNETADYEEKYSGKPVEYQCVLTSHQCAPSGSMLTLAGGSQLHILLVAVLVVQVILVFALILAVMTIMRQMRSLRR